MTDSYELARTKKIVTVGKVLSTLVIVAQFLRVEFYSKTWGSGSCLDQ